MGDGVLTILPSLVVRPLADGRVGMTQKFLSGVELFGRSWGGRVRVLMEQDTGGGGGQNDLDAVEREVGELPFELRVVRYDSPTIGDELQGSAVVLLAAHYRQLPLADVCAGLGGGGVPAVFVSENSFWTRMQMLSVSRVNPIVRIRRAIWLMGEERRLRRAVRQAAGVQCNGVPTFEAYRGISKNPLLYFDSRVREKQLASEAAVRERHRRRLERGTLRLAFTGRLVAIKGVDHLAGVAGELKRAGKTFELTIVGAGEMEAVMRRQVQERGLGDCVMFKGVMDFERGLLPFVRDNVDVFVCCHRQGDPSCTYLETMSCGVPIAGYGNEAFRGLAEQSGAGWVTAMNKPAELATKIAGLQSEEILEHSLRALKFAREHTFEKTFARRAEHLRQIAEAASAKPLGAAAPMAGAPGVA